jgi:hypothetical protein
MAIGNLSPYCSCLYSNHSPFCSCLYSNHSILTVVSLYLHIVKGLIEKV